jgi:hypothetical protein
MVDSSFRLCYVTTRRRSVQSRLGQTARHPSGSIYSLGTTQHLSVLTWRSALTQADRHPDLIATLPNAHTLVAISGTDMKKPSSIGCSMDLRLVPATEEDLPGCTAAVPASTSAGRRHSFGVDEPMMLHRGFRECFRRMRGSLKIKILEEIKRGSRVIELAGYSLGECMCVCICVYVCECVRVYSGAINL